MNAEALRRTLETGEIHFYSRSRDELWHKGETSGNVQRVRQLRYDCDGDALVALVEPGRPRLPHRASAHASTATSTAAADPRRTPPAPGEPRPPPTRRWPRSSARCRAARRAARRLLHGRAARRPAANRREGARGGRRGRARRGAAESDERVAEEAADVLYHLEVLLLLARRLRSRRRWRRSMAVAAESEPRARAGPRAALGELGSRDGNVIPVRYRFVDDCETPVSAFLKLRERRALVPARVGRAGPARPLLVPRLPPARRCCAGATASAERDEPRRRSVSGTRRARPLRAPSPTTSAVHGRPARAACRRSPAARSGFFGYDLVRTVEPLGEPNPDPIGLPDMALMVMRPDARLRPHAPRGDPHRLRLRRRRGRHRGRLRARRRG